MRISDWSQTCALPIFSVTEEIAVDLEQWVRRAGSIRLLVAGSFHHRDREPSGRRSNRALAWVRGHAAPLSHDKHSPADRPAAEDISPAGWTELRDRKSTRLNSSH